jgi:radical SAM superfamily enzyme YgiQ (UPF0313 family)
MASQSPKVLLTSIFKPCGVDDMYGRKECVAEVHHNQLTQHQGVYSPRYWWPSMGTHLMGPNIGADVTVLDWPTLADYEREIKKGYDYIGISFIHPTLQKFKKMVERARALAPDSKIIAGGFGATISNIERICDIDYVCQGEGIRFMRDLLGKSPEFEFVHPKIHCEIVEMLGIPVNYLTPFMKVAGADISSIVTNILITGLGCTNGCEFCATSHFYNCAHLPFMRTGREIYDEMEKKSKITGSKAFFFLGDENFCLDRKRMEDLWKLQKDSKDEYIIRLLFASVDQLEKYDPEMLAEMDIDHIWVGIESQQFPYPKTKGRDPKKLIDSLKEVGIKIILSSILYLDGHTKENISKDVDFHISLRPEHSQFAGLSVHEGTPLFERMNEENRILHEVPMEERHAFKQIWFNHPEFSPYESEIYQKHAYGRDLNELGPSLVRSMMTSAYAFPKLAKSSKPRLRQRAVRLAKEAEAAKAVCLASAKVADTEEMRSMLMGWLGELELITSPISKKQIAIANGIAAFAKFRKFRNKIGLDTIQPKSVKTSYPAR